MKLTCYDAGRDLTMNNAQSSESKLTKCDSTRFFIIVTSVNGPLCFGHCRYQNSCFDNYMQNEAISHFMLINENLKKKEKNPAAIRTNL